MLDSPALNLLALIVAIFAQGATCLVFGELLCRWLARFSPWDARVPEFALLLGYAGCSLAGYLVLAVSTSAAAVPIGVLLAAIGMWIYTGRDLPSAGVPAFLARYREVRATPIFRAAILLAALFPLGICVYRIPWLLDVTTSRGVLFGTGIWDDVRTIGFPISLAAYGYPMRSPIAMETQLVYPLGAFVNAAGLTAWMPRLALPILLGDTLWQAAFYSITVLILCATLLEGIWSRLLLTATALLGSSYNLWGLGLDPKAQWFDTLFGYYRNNAFYTTIGFRPYSGTLWISNHVLAFAALLLAACWFAHRGKERDWTIALLLATFGASCSVDMAAMGAVAASLSLAPRFVVSLLKQRRIDTHVWRGIAICAACTALVLVINLPALTGRVDSPYDILFPPLVTPSYNAGIFLSHNLFYILLLVIGTIMMRSFAAYRTIWIVPALTGVIFSFLFEFHSIWFWRFSVASHFLFGLLCARHLDLLRSRAYSLLWSVTLIPGLIQAAEDLKPRFVIWTSPDRAAASQWIYEHAPLQSRVAEYREDEDSLVPDISMLRVGNRAGYRVYDRSHALVGYKEYAGRMGSLDTGIAYNDFLLVSRTASEVDRVLADCGAQRPYENSTVRIYAVNSGCRARMSDPDLQIRVRKYQYRIRMRAALSINKDPYKLPMELYQLYVIEHPEHITGFRKRLEFLWGAGMWPQAVKWIEPVVAAHPESAEANYSYAFSLQCGNIDVRKAIKHYDAAEAAGYPPFWTTYNRGGAYLQIKDYKRARIDLERACAIDPKHADARRLLDQLNKAVQ